MYFFKILSKDLNHNDFQYKEGLNIDTVPFNPQGDCEPGGLYFTDKEHILDYIYYGTLIADVLLPEDAKVYKSGNNWKADKIFLLDIRPIEDFVSTLAWREILKSVKQNGLILRYVQLQTPKICLEAVKQYGHTLQFVKEQTPEICLEAVKQDGHALRFVKKQTRELCLEAIRQSSDAFRYVKVPTPELYLEAERCNQNEILTSEVENQNELFLNKIEYLFNV